MREKGLRQGSGKGPEEGKGAAGGGCEASGRVAGAGGARGAAERVWRARTELSDSLASSQSPRAPPFGGRKSSLVRQRCRFGLSVASIQYNYMGAVCGHMVWCGGMCCTGCPPANVSPREDIVACNSMTFVRFASNGVKQPARTTRATEQKQASRQSVCVRQRRRREGPPWDACGRVSVRNRAIRDRK